jgi:lysophospholipase L1-like esterase
MKIEKIKTKSSLSILGDSFMQYGQDSVAGMYSNSFIQWFNDYAALSNSELDMLFNYGAGGKTIQELISQQLPLAEIDGTKVAWVHIGVNNLNPTSFANDSINTILGHMETVVSRLSKCKSLVIIDGLLPVNQNGSTSSKTRAQEIPLINAGYKRICARYDNVIFNDIYASILDTTSADLNPIENTTNSTDGIHLTTYGAQLVGHASYNNIIPYVDIQKYRKTQEIALPTFSGTGGTTTVGSGSISGGSNIPASWNVQVASGAAAVTVSTQAPDKIRLAITNAGATSTIYFQALNNAALTAALTVGKTYQAKFDYKTSGMVLVTRIVMTTRLNSTSPLWHGGGVSPNETTPFYTTGNISGRRITPPRTLTSSPSNFEFIMAFNVGATTGALNIDISNPQLIEIL